MPPSAASPQTRPKRIGPPTKKTALSPKARPASDITRQRGSGSSILEELQEALHANHARVLDLFKKWDEDGSGTIQKKELRKALSALGHNASEVAVSELFNSFDTGGNGMIEYKEFHRAIQRRQPAPALLDKWFAHKSTQDGREYYYNPALNVTTWDAPPEWKKREDRFFVWKAFEAPDGGGTYYFNVDTQETTWTRPRNEQIEFSPWYVGDAAKVDPAESPPLMLSPLNFFNPAAAKRALP